MNVKHTPLTLAGDFPAATYEQWVSAASQSSQGNGLAHLTAVTLDGISIDPLYPRAQGLADTLGQYPYTRSGTLTGNAGYGWEIRQNYQHPSPAICNQQILQELSRGVTAVNLTLCAAACRAQGLTVDTPFNAQGVELYTIDDLTTVLHGVYLNLIRISFSSGAAFASVATMLKTLWTQQQLVGEQCIAAFNGDPVGTLAAYGELPVDLEESLHTLGMLAAETVNHFPNATAVAVDTTMYHNAGASDAQELALMLATGKFYLQAMLNHDIDINDACRQIECQLATDTDYFQSAAKLRAARTVWAKMTDACGATGDARVLRVCAHTSQRMLTKPDPWVNILRTTVAGAGAAMGGADSMTVDAFDQVFGMPTELGRRVARNIPVILMEESGIHKVIDPLGGSGFIEHLTAQLSEKTWEQFQSLEANGGILPALKTDVVQTMIEQTHKNRMRAVRHCELPMVGVSEFPLLDETQPVVDEKLKAAALSARAQALARGTGTTVKPASVVPIRAIKPHRLSEPFESVRAALDKVTSDTGSRPGLYLAALGTVAEYLPRVQFVRNLLAAGGITTTLPEGTIDITQTRQHFIDSKFTVVAVCVGRNCDDALAADLVTQLKSAGAASVLFAGTAPLPDSPLARTGIDHYLHKGCDAVAALEHTARALGVTL